MIITTHEAAQAYLDARAAHPENERVWVAKHGGQGLHYANCLTLHRPNSRGYRLATVNDVLKVAGHACSFCDAYDSPLPAPTPCPTCGLVHAGECG